MAREFRDGAQGRALPPRREPQGGPDKRTLNVPNSLEWLGHDWEDDLSVSRGYYWEEHHYCEAEEGFEDVVQEHVAKGDVVRASRVVSIGPWCVYWWERFPSGYRLELELGEP